MNRAKLISSLVVGLLAFPACAGASQLLRLDGLGPLRLGMTRGEAVRTGWLAHRAKGCELASPRPITYTLTGPKAPTRVTGLAQFQNGRLTSISATRGVHTAAGVVVGRTTSRHMISVYSAPPFSASSMFSSTFGGTFTTVKRNGKTVLQGFGAHKRVTLLAIPAVQVCD